MDAMGRPAVAEDALQPEYRPRDTCPCGDGPRPGHPSGWCGQGYQQRESERRVARLDGSASPGLVEHENARATPEDLAWLESELRGMEAGVEMASFQHNPRAERAWTAEASRVRRILNSLRAGEPGVGGGGGPRGGEVEG